MTQTESISQSLRPILNLFATVRLGYFAEEYDVCIQGFKNLCNLFRCGPLPTSNIISNNPKLGCTDLSVVKGYK
jgi:hypothetical protein